MNAALVTSFYEPPHYSRIPVPSGAGELVDVLAVAIHPDVRATAEGAECRSLGDPPYVPGSDAVGRRADGRLVYFRAAHEVFGTMAERAIAMPDRTVDLPSDADVAAVAAQGCRPQVFALADIEQAWRAPEPSGVRTVIVPSLH